MNSVDIISLVSSLGFPIVMCGGLCWYIVKRQDKMNEVIDNNTKAIMLLVNELDGDKNDKH